ncbi:hypothetical protein QYE76_043850 [Lolium multiflorum]|uniref:Integrase catalytic domain-containing protein n=1 Tax=Lolium multiflorum TaxID=4521 RepID=A0AAD8TJT3_LOLMU|nr:hypothetical protein QYE76_043850 [Lolium multiflorum]
MGRERRQHGLVSLPCPAAIRFFDGREFHHVPRKNNEAAMPCPRSANPAIPGIALAVIKKPSIIPQADQEAGWLHTVTFLKEIIARYGYPHSIITDNGSNFAEGIFKRYCGEMGIRMDLSSVAHPRPTAKWRKQMA